MVDGGWDEWSECREFGVGHDSTETQVILGPFQYVGTKGKFKQFSKFQKWWLYIHLILSNTSFHCYTLSSIPHVDL